VWSPRHAEACEQAQIAPACFRRQVRVQFPASQPSARLSGRADLCHGDWAAVSVNAPSVGPGEGFLLYTTSGWAGGQLDGGYYFCSHLASAFNPPVPPQALAVALFTKAGLCPR
jgi:hypothetical protein